jgi:cystathionine gamma-synthase
VTVSADLEGLGFETNAVHGGDRPTRHRSGQHPGLPVLDLRAGRRRPDRGFEYARSGNPSRASLERHLALLEGATFGFAFASGLAAEDAVMRLLVPATISSCRPTATEERSGWPPRSTAGPGWLSTPSTSPTWMTPGIRQTRMVWLESPTNPLLHVIDIAAVSAAAHSRGALVVVDNTFATPWIQQPLSLGADIVVHSTTKYLGGHSDVVGGFAATSDEDIAGDWGSFRMPPAPCPGPSTAFSCSVG